MTVKVHNRSLSTSKYWETTLRNLFAVSIFKQEHDLLKKYFLINEMHNISARNSFIFYRILTNWKKWQPSNDISMKYPAVARHLECTLKEKKTMIEKKNQYKPNFYHVVFIYE